jgi:hypothetical protein
MTKAEKKKAKAFFELVIDSAKESIKKNRKGLKLLEQGKCHYRIHLKSLWANEGEKSLTYDAEPGVSLKKAAKLADLAFMKQNHRSDVQADKFAHLIMDNGSYAYMEHPHEEKKRKERRKKAKDDQRRKNQADKEAKTRSENEKRFCS